MRVTETHYVWPQPKYRAKRSDTWKKPPAAEKWKAFKDEVRRLGVTLEEGDGVIFVIRMPDSWSEKKRCAHEGQPHRQVPDLDNLLGGLQDAVHPDGDSHLACFTELRKIWGRTAAIVVTPKERTGQ